MNTIFMRMAVYGWRHKVNKILLQKKILLPRAILTPSEGQATNILRFTVFYSYFYKKYCINVEYCLPAGEEGICVNTWETQHYFISEHGRKTQKRDVNALQTANILLDVLIKNINTVQSNSILDGIVKRAEITD